MLLYKLHLIFEELFNASLLMINIFIFAALLFVDLRSEGILFFLLRKIECNLHLLSLPFSLFPLFHIFK